MRPSTDRLGDVERPPREPAGEAGLPVGEGLRTSPPRLLTLLPPVRLFAPLFRCEAAAVVAVAVEPGADAALWLRTGAVAPSWPSPESEFSEATNQLRSVLHAIRAAKVLVLDAEAPGDGEDNGVRTAGPRSWRSRGFPGDIPRRLGTKARSAGRSCSTLGAWLWRGCSPLCSTFSLEDGSSSFGWVFSFKLLFEPRLPGAQPRTDPAPVPVRPDKGQPTRRRFSEEYPSLKPLGSGSVLSSRSVLNFSEFERFFP
mmetsp:Transcript_89249/g.147792  ORF Transcript_89249/g.147792 Transcript_89249/m.147792 type:complete len:256 (+) Transcript_89249:321-1088(+)